MLKTYLLSQRKKILELISTIVGTIISGSIGIIISFVGLQQTTMPKAVAFFLILSLILSILTSIIIIQIGYQFIMLISTNTTAEAILTSIINENVRKDVTNNMD